MSLNQFINTGADDATVNDMKKSIAREEDLQKAMNRAGLVQKEVQVQGKNGTTFTRKQWVKASDAQSTGTTGTSSASKGDAKPTSSTSTDDVSKKVDDLVKQYSKADYDIQAAKFSHDANAETRARSRRTEAQKKLKELGYKPQKSKDVKGLFTAQKIEDSTLKDKSSGKQSSRFKREDFKLPKSGNRGNADELLSMVNKLDESCSVVGIRPEIITGHGTFTVKTYKITGKPGSELEVRYGSDAQGVYFIADGEKYRDVNSLVEHIKSSRNDQGKMNHQTGMREKKAATMIEDYFAGNHSHDDGKKALAGLLGKGYTREDIMAQAEKSGVTWKKNDHAGINWMRASMAIQKHLNSIKESSSNAEAKSNKTQYKTGTIDKNGELKPSGDNELEDMVKEMTDMDLPDLTDLVRTSNNLDVSNGSSGIESAKVLPNGKLNLEIYLEGYDENSEDYIDDVFTIEVPISNSSSK